MRTTTDILIVFRPPVNAQVDIGDVLQVDLEALDQIQEAQNLTKNTRLAVELRSHDVHDLRLPSGHGAARFPTDERRKRA